MVTAVKFPSMSIQETIIRVGGRGGGSRNQVGDGA